MKVRFEVTGTDFSETARRNLEAIGVKTVATVREDAAASDFVIVVVGFDSEPEIAVLGPDNIRPGVKPRFTNADGRPPRTRIDFVASARHRQHACARSLIWNSEFSTTSTATTLRCATSMPSG